MFERDIESYFDGVLENIDIILDNGFYNDEDKEGLKYVKLKIKDWYKIYMEKIYLRVLILMNLKRLIWK